MVGREKEFLVDNLLVRIHFIIEMIWWTGLRANASFSLNASVAQVLSNAEKILSLQLPRFVPQAAGFR